MVGHESGVPAVVNLKCLVSHSAMRKLAMVSCAPPDACNNAANAVLMNASTG